jgi:hypothetical protein
LGWGLPLLLQFGKLYGIRPELQRLIILQYMMIESGKSFPDLLDSLRLGWEPILRNRHLLTSDEMQGLAGIMGIFLFLAVPLVNDHYAEFPRSSKSVPCLLNVLEMVGWSVTLDPDADLPFTLLEETLRCAAKKRLIKNLRVTAEKLPEAIIQVTEEINNASEDLLRDVEIQSGIKDKILLVEINSHVRYHTICDHLEMVFFNKPGANIGDMKVGRVKQKDIGCEL